MIHSFNIAIVCNTLAGNGYSAHAYPATAGTAGKPAYSLYCFYGRRGLHNSNGFSDVFILGGDGTLNHFINQYPNISIPLSVFKGGSGNDFGWKLYGNLSFEAQVRPRYWHLLPNRWMPAAVTAACS